MWEIRSIPNHGEWDLIVERHPAGTLFHTRGWLELLGHTQGARLLALGLFRHGRLVGVCPVFLRRMGPFMIAGSPLVAEDTPYLGPVVDPAFLPDVLTRLSDILAGHGARFIRMLLSPAYGFAALPRYEVKEKRTHVVDLELGRDQLWTRMEGRARTAIRKAEKSNVEIVWASPQSYLEEYWKMVEDVYGRQGRRPPNPLAFYRRLFDTCYPASVAMLLARHEGRMVGGMILAWQKDRAYYLNGASYRSCQPLGVNSLLQWEAMQWAAKLGCRWYDFVGSDLPWLARFKESFGGTLTPYLAIEHASSWVVRLCRRQYATWKGFAGVWTGWRPSFHT
ncbi:lipid II:glycine glycyltransferase FemX [Candidatus Nitrospira bockiana]